MVILRQRCDTWSPSQNKVNQSLLKKFAKDIPHQDFRSLHKWSLSNVDSFWTKVWDFCGIIGEKGSVTVRNIHNVEKALFFPEGQLNFAENILKVRQGKEVVISSASENGQINHMKYSELYGSVSKLSEYFRIIGLTKGDRVAGYLPNIPEGIVSMLSTAAIGGVWTCCSPDFGVKGVVDRLSQVSPRVLIAADGYSYNGKEFPCLDKIVEIVQQLPSVEVVILLPYLNENKSDLSLPSQLSTLLLPLPPTSRNIRYLSWEEVMRTETDTNEIRFTRVGFNHPLYILYSSGTTGAPKCIVHGVGGTLLKHLSEHQLHCDLQPEQGHRAFFFTTCSWMMWHWLITILASRVPIVLYEGSPFHPSPLALLDMAQQLQLTHFGVSAKYLSALHKLGVNVTDSHPLRDLNTIWVTGSPLLPETQDFIHSNIKSDVRVSSMSGGTDLLSCFVLGNPWEPVHRGEIQGPSLGHDVAVLDEVGQPRGWGGGPGELTCLNAFPSRPLGFWGDDGGDKYHKAYYSRYPNVWHHGDYCEWTGSGGMVIHGRSDTTLNPGGVRIGTAELYGALEDMVEVKECLAVGQLWEGEERVVLLVVLSDLCGVGEEDRVVIPEEVVVQIMRRIRERCSPRHVPSKIVAVPDLPRTRNNKLSEVAARDVIRGERVKNREALLNPECLDVLARIPSLYEG